MSHHLEARERMTLAVRKNSFGLGRRVLYMPKICHIVRVLVRMLQIRVWHSCPGPHQVRCFGTEKNGTSLPCTGLM